MCPTPSQPDSPVQHPKVAVLGCGSLFFGRQAIWQMVHSPHLNTGTLALVDTDQHRLTRMAELARKVVDDTGVKLAIEASCDRKDVLADCDFVVLTFATDSVKYRDIDCKLSAKYGIRMCSGDTVGPGGILRTLRALPEALTVARDVEDICPDAWVINYINPTASIGLGLKRYASNLKSFALCDGNRMPNVRHRNAVRAGVIKSESDYTDETDRKLDLHIGGPNHFTWLYKASYDGRDILPNIAESIRREDLEKTPDPQAGPKQKYNGKVICQLYNIYGAIPTAAGHTKEYVRFWQGLGKTPEPIPPITLWDASARYKRHDAMWQQVDDLLSGSIPISKYMEMFESDHATDIIETMAAGMQRQFYINTLNDGAIGNMGNDRFMELLCDVDASGPKTVSVGDVPAGLRGLWAQVLDAHELAAEAAVTGQHNLLRRAMLTDPLVSSIADAEALIDELLVAEQQVLPNCWQGS